MGWRNKQIWIPASLNFFRVSLCISCVFNCDDYFFIYYTIQWIEIYPVDSVIYLLSNYSQELLFMLYEMPCFRFFTNHPTDCSHIILRLAKIAYGFFFTFIFSVHGTLDSVDQVGSPCYTKETKFCCLWNWNCCFIIHVTWYPLVSVLCLFGH